MDTELSKQILGDLSRHLNAAADYFRRVDEQPEGLHVARAIEASSIGLMEAWARVEGVWVEDGTDGTITIADE